VSEVTMWRSRWRCVIKPVYSVSFLLSINIFVWQNVLHFPNDSHIYQMRKCKSVKLALSPSSVFSWTLCTCQSKKPVHRRWNNQYCFPEVAQVSILRCWNLWNQLSFQPTPSPVEMNASVEIVNKHVQVWVICVCN
jgi:hypothetical protein